MHKSSRESSNITIISIIQSYFQICGECGKGFYRKDHLRKHAKSHALKRQKELNAQVGQQQLSPTQGVQIRIDGTGADGGGVVGKPTKPKGGKSKKAQAAAAAAAAATANNNNSVNHSNNMMPLVTSNESSIPIFQIPISTISSPSGVTTTVTASVNIPRDCSELNSNNNNNNNSVEPPSNSAQTQNHMPLMSSSNTTILHIPTGDNTTLPVQIQLPDL